MIKTKKHGWLRPKTRQDKAKAEAASEHLRETVEKLPSWAKPIVVKHLTKYLNIISDLDNADPKERASALVFFMSKTAPKIVSELIEELKLEASKRGYGAIRLAVKEALQNPTIEKHTN